MERHQDTGAEAAKHRREHRVQIGHIIPSLPNGRHQGLSRLDNLQRRLGGKTRAIYLDGTSSRAWEGPSQVLCNHHGSFTRRSVGSPRFSCCSHSPDICSGIVSQENHKGHQKLPQPCGTKLLRRIPLFPGSNTTKRSGTGPGLSFLPP